MNFNPILDFLHEKHSIEMEYNCGDKKCRWFTMPIKNGVIL